MEMLEKEIENFSFCHSREGGNPGLFLPHLFDMHYINRSAALAAFRRFASSQSAF